MAACLPPRCGVWVARQRVCHHEAPSADEAAEDDEEEEEAKTQLHLHLPTPAAVAVLPLTAASWTWVAQIYCSIDFYLPAGSILQTPLIPALPYLPFEPHTVGGSPWPFSW